MKHVNFLETAVASRGKFELNYFWIMLIICGLVALAIIFGFIYKQRLKNAEIKLQALSAEVTRLKASGSLALKKTNSSLLSRPIPFGNLLKKVSGNVPPFVTLTHLDGTLKGNRTLTIKGQAPAPQYVLLLKNNLATMQECEKIALLELSQAEKEGGKEYLSFQLECKLR